MMAPFSSSSLTAASNQASLRRRQLRYSNLSLTKNPQCLFRSEHLMLETQIVMLTMTVMFSSENIWSKNGLKIWAGADPTPFPRSRDAQRQFLL